MPLLIGVNNYRIYAQKIPILNYSTNSNGQIQLEVKSSKQNYYILKVRHHKDSLFDIFSSITLGGGNTTTITEPLSAYPIENYEVIEYRISSPEDTDGDGINDIIEYQNIPLQSPLNSAKKIDINNGTVMIESLTTFKKLSIKKDFVVRSEFLNGKEFVKYIIVDFHTKPKIFFINSKKYNLHADFANAFGIDYLGDHVKKGQIIYHPKSVSNNGSLGTFAFNYSNGRPQKFNVVRRTQELLAANMPFLKNNLAHLITENNEAEYYKDSTSYDSSRVSVLLESDIYAKIDYWGLNQAEGYGFFRKMDLKEVPRQKDLVLYESLPNTLPRVGGIITSVIQTPLSHVNLRAIQNNIPNAFIRDPLSIDSISELLNDYIYFKVEHDKYFIRKATLKEVNEWFENIRPKKEQSPPLNLDFTKILPLNEIDFTMYDGFGAKCANVATMRSFGFPDGTIPNGFGIPFYFYQRFMEYNNFFEEVNLLINNPDFKSDRNTREHLLKGFRKKIKSGKMPSWMMNELAEMHTSLPENTSIRCRSSSNNEDLAGFNGAGLYDSKTQHPHEGHISKSIKQVYASLWNLRAFEEREFYRINHTTTSMGILCHPNYSDEKANGVGISVDPIYNTDNTFYLNSQVGEELITNPNTSSIPEEILLDKFIGRKDDYLVIQHSNLVPENTTIMNRVHLEQMRDYLSVINNKFQLLYSAINNKSFAMDIEYKITNAGQLIIKQARPWVSYVANEKTTNNSNLNLKIFPNPAQNYINLKCDNCNLSKVKITNIMGAVFLERGIISDDNTSTKIDLKKLPPGTYILIVLKKGNVLYSSEKFIIK